MELRHLRQFIAVAEEQHITRAAERLRMQQPPLSQRIRAMERELDVQLLVRKARGVELTESGRVFLHSARTILAEYERLFEATRRAARGEEGRLRVGINPTASFHPLVPSVIREFRATFPLVSLTLEECLRVQAIAGLRGGTMDVAVVRSVMTQEEDLATTPLVVEPMVVALPAAHALSRPKRALAVRELVEESFIFYAREFGPTLYEATMAACVKAGFTPRFGQEAPRATSALSLVAGGFGITVVPASMQHLTMNGVVYRAFKGSVQPKTILKVVSRRGERSPVVRNFLNLTKRMFRSAPGAS